MKYSIIAIGDELLIGQVTDTNSGWIARHMTPRGWDVNTIQVVPDDAEQIKLAIDRAFAQTDVVLMTGGLGPTKDDITKPTLCRYFGGEMVLDEAVEANVRQVMERRHLKLHLKINEYTRLQAMVPSSCRVIQNEMGTAPLMWFERDGKVLVSMPGVPFELQGMMERAVIPQLLARFNDGEDIEFRTFVVTGIIESALAMQLDEFERNMPHGIHLAYLPEGGIIRLRLTGSSTDARQINDDMERLSRQLHDILGGHIIADGDKRLPEILGDRLRERGLTLATAESCTGGNIAHQITSIAGSSDYFKGAVVSYANEVKMSLLGVSEQDIIDHGVVSEPVVRQMVEGACRAIGTDCAIATSGIAGPGGGTPTCPVTVTASSPAPPSRHSCSCSPCCKDSSPSKRLSPRANISEDNEINEIHIAAACHPSCRPCWDGKCNP